MVEIVAKHSNLGRIVLTPVQAITPLDIDYNQPREPGKLRTKYVTDARWGKTLDVEPRCPLLNEPKELLESASAGLRIDLHEPISKSYYQFKACDPADNPICRACPLSESILTYTPFVKSEIIPQKVKQTDFHERDKDYLEDLKRHKLYYFFQRLVGWMGITIAAPTISRMEEKVGDSKLYLDELKRATSIL